MILKCNFLNSEVCIIHFPSGPHDSCLSFSRTLRKLKNPKLPFDFPKNKKLPMSGGDAGVKSQGGDF